MADSADKASFDKPVGMAASTAPLDTGGDASGREQQSAGEKRKRPVQDQGRKRRSNGSHGSRRDWKTNSRPAKDSPLAGKRVRIDEARSKAAKSNAVPAVYTSHFSKEEIEAEERKPKRKVAVMLGYAGTGYHGMQLNPRDKTIEGDLFQAFVKAGAISKVNADDPRKVSFVRCARTDKGVHAAGNVISLKLVIEDPDIVKKINDNLVPQIRVWGIERTTNSFSAYNHVDSRIYEYLIPTHCFLPPHPRSFLGRKLAELAEEVGDTQGWKERLQDVSSFWDDAYRDHVQPVLNQYDANLGEEAWNSIFDREGHDGETVDDAKVQNGGDLQEVVAETGTPADAPEKASKSGKGGKLYTEVESAALRLKAAIRDAKKAWRITPETLEKVRAALGCFEGVRNYHNYTIRMNAKDPSAVRVIKSFVVSRDPILIDGTEWLSLKVHGQSFMMHQIRKMVGMAALAVRCGTHRARFQDTMEHGRLSIPRAPGLGLLLERPIFESYNQKTADQQGGPERNPVSFEPYQKEMDEFKQREIYDRIHREEAVDNQFHQLFWSLDNLRRTQLLYLSSKGLSAIGKGDTFDNAGNGELNDAFGDGADEDYVTNEGN